MFIVLVLDFRISRGIGFEDEDEDEDASESAMTSPDPADFGACRDSEGETRLWAE